MITEEKVRELLSDMESDLIERTISIKESKLGPAVCALSNDFPNHRKPGYILLGVHDDGKIAGMTWTDAEWRKEQWKCFATTLIDGKSGFQISRG
jgi:ATP-dependent DNA helicase RecG